MLEPFSDCREQFAAARGRCCGLFGDQNKRGSRRSLVNVQLLDCRRAFFEAISDNDVRRAAHGDGHALLNI